MSLHDSLTLATRWLIGPGMVQGHAGITPEHEQRHPMRSWDGAVWGEMRMRDGRWRFFCPIWHTGQAAAALAMASEHVGEPALDGLKRAADFLCANQVADGPDAGLLLAYEDFPNLINTSAQLESLDGLFAAADTLNEPRYEAAALACLNWVADHAWLEGEGLLLDLYDPEARAFSEQHHWGRGRPLLDSGVWAKGYQRTGDQRFRKIACDIAERLLTDEHPQGNWVTYQPCLRYEQCLHPRHAFWWGRGLREVYDMTGDGRFALAFRRSVDWYSQNLRVDGGVFRQTRMDGNSASFNHSASSSACAALMFIDAIDHFSDLRCVSDLVLSLQFVKAMQIVETDDPSLRGVLVEGYIKPDGTDRNPMFIRDLATIFYIQAACRTLASERISDISLLLTVPENSPVPEPVCSG